MKSDRRPPPRRGSEPAPQRDRWLLSYADFLTLLLALFVVLYASALVDVEKNRGLFEGLQSAFTKGTPASEENDPGRVPDAVGDLAPQKQLESNLAKRLDRERARIQADPGVSLHPTERGLVISLAAAEYFRPGSAEIRASRRPVLAAMAPLLAAESAPLLFEGHTDDPRTIRSIPRTGSFRAPAPPPSPAISSTSTASTPSGSRPRAMRPIARSATESPRANAPAIAGSRSWSSPSRNA